MFAPLVTIPAIWLAGAIALGTVIRAGRPSARIVVLAFLATLAVMFSTYLVGKMDGEGLYFTAVKAELNPLLWRLRETSPEPQKAILSDFLLSAIGSKVEPDQYLRALRKANAAVGKLPNQPTLPPGVGLSMKTGGAPSVGGHGP